MREEITKSLIFSQHKPLTFKHKTVMFQPTPQTVVLYGHEPTVQAKYPLQFCSLVVLQALSILSKDMMLTSVLEQRHYYTSHFQP